MRDELLEYLDDLAWLEPTPEHGQEVIRYKEFFDRIDNLSYVVTILVTEEEGPDYSEFTYESYINITGLKGREDIQDVDDIMDNELKTHITRLGMDGVGIGPKTLKRLVIRFENKCLTEVYKILNKCAQIQD